MFLHGFVTYAIIAFIALIVISNVQPDPYIDEVFHMTQAKHYCRREFFVWDSKITTLPGLYLLSAGINDLLGFYGLPTVCSTFGLRTFNMLTSFASFYVFYNIFKVMNNIRNPRYVTWEAFNLSTLPVAFFFNFLYYTDTLSTFLVLLMFLLNKTEYYKTATCIGFISVLVRQTNVVWVGFLFLENLVKFFNTFFPNGLSDFDMDFSEFRTLDSLTFCFRNYDIYPLSSIAGFCFVCLLFITFVLKNGGIVIGDRQAHEPTLHICQLFYFTMFLMIFLYPYLLKVIRPFINFCKRRIMIIICLAILMAITIFCNTIAHPYLLADNRHYSFYLWKNLYLPNDYRRYIFIPIYIFGFYAIKYHLKNQALYINYMITISILLIPQRLLEFRYFILPYYFLRMHINPGHDKLLLTLETFNNLFINFLTFYVFVTKEFYWVDSQQIQRIVW